MALQNRAYKDELDPASSSTSCSLTDFEVDIEAKACELLLGSALVAELLCDGISRDYSPAASPQTQEKKARDAICYPREMLSEFGADFWGLAEDFGQHQETSYLPWTSQSGCTERRRPTGAMPGKDFPLETAVYPSIHSGVIAPPGQWLPPQSQSVKSRTTAMDPRAANVEVIAASKEMKSPTAKFCVFCGAAKAIQQQRFCPHCGSPCVI
eukprot:CAMPEP_0170575114 /NCGR_PEP_ID=MMETSP0224-20130122/3679_1 /TAXON_ID=285029 /ORGANISM="Togula jolla, Strain CCCM 725" /LENGTH=210 /DNA_ID=CAMNT_0010897853 /DNA_START=52 /DNA_END=684 /DNA_ORIENTATION=-